MVLEKLKIKFVYSVRKMELISLGAFSASFLYLLMKLKWKEDNGFQGYDICC